MNTVVFVCVCIHCYLCAFLKLVRLDGTTLGAVLEDVVCTQSRMLESFFCQVVSFWFVFLVSKRAYWTKPNANNDNRWGYYSRDISFRREHTNALRFFDVWSSLKVRVFFFFAFPRQQRDSYVICRACLEMLLQKVVIRENTKKRPRVN